MFKTDANYYCMMSSRSVHQRARYITVVVIISIFVLCEKFRRFKNRVSHQKVSRPRVPPPNDGPTTPTLPRTLLGCALDPTPRRYCAGLPIPDALRTSSVLSFAHRPRRARGGGSEEGLAGRALARAVPFKRLCHLKISCTADFSAIIGRGTR